MWRFINLEGERFGRLVVLRRLENLRPGATRWLCKCDCGGTAITYTTNLKGGLCRSCGCLHIEAARERGFKSAKHGMCNTRLFRVWSNMKTRCYNKNNKSYERWGKRGIYVCDEWKNDFKAFYDWAMQSGYSDELSIDRIDNNGPYSPENCRWVTPLEQANNTRKTRFIEFGGERHSLHEWSRIVGVNVTTLFYRLKRMSIGEALGQV